MGREQDQERRQTGAEVVDFDEAMLDACAPQERADLAEEAELLASVFAPRRRARDLARMAAQLSAGERHAGPARHHVRRLEAALKRLARVA